MILWDVESGLKRAWVNLPPGSIPTCCSVSAPRGRLPACGGFNASIEVFDITKCMKAGKHGLFNNLDNFVNQSSGKGNKEQGEVKRRWARIHP